MITDPVEQKRAKHAVYENQRTIEAVSALKAGNIERFGELMNQSHISLRDDYAVSCEEIDLLVDLAWQIPGVVGYAVDTFINTIGPAYKEKVGHEAEFYTVDIGSGAQKLETL